MAPKIRKLKGFEQAALLRLAWTDAQISTCFSLVPALEKPRHDDAALARQLGEATALTSKRLLCRTAAIEANNFVCILDPTLAVTVRCWVQLKHGCFGLCQKMYRENDAKSWLSVRNSVWKIAAENRVSSLRAYFAYLSRVLVP